MLPELFSSQARVAILQLFLLEQGKRFYQREIAVLSKQPLRAVQREVAKLLKIGILKEEFEGNRKYYTINKNSPVVGDLKAIFQKTVGIYRVLSDALEPLREGIDIAFVFGSYACGEESTTSDVDLLIIGDVSGRKLAGALKGIKSLLAREINPAVFTMDEFSSRLQKKDHFLTTVNKAPKQFIIGTENEYRTILKRGPFKKA